jgi:tRNA-dihydrouridine synthase B
MLFHNITIGNLKLKSNIFIAPLAGYTNLPTRIIYRSQGAGIAYSEMVSALGLNYNFDKSFKLIKTEKPDKPLGVQLFGPDSKSFLNAYLKIKDSDFDLLDINCGCSVKKVLKAKSGADLLKRPDEIYKIVKTIKDNCDKPVTIKIRSGWNEQSLNYLEVLDASIKGGIDLVTFHPRTRSMLFAGKADWKLIKIMKEKSSVPIIGNGDIFTGEGAVQMINETGCDGIMVARGLIENPFLIEEVKAHLKGQTYSPPSLDKRIDTMITHCKMMVEYFGEKTGICEFRKFVRGYLKNLKDVSKIRQILNKIENFNEFKKIIFDYHQLLKNDLRVIKS